MGLFDLFRKKEDTSSNPSITIKPEITITYSTPTRQEIEQQASAEAEETAKLDAKCKKSAHGLSVSQILLLEYCKKGKYPNPEGGYQRFWWFEYGVKSVGDALKQLLDKGFIRFALPSELLPTLKVNELKKILADMGLSVSGKKAALVERILQNADNEYLQQFLHSEKYTLTELGEQEVSENEYIPYLHSHKYTEISVWDVNQNADLKHWRDYIWGRFNKCSMDYAADGQWGLYRNVRFSMAEFLKEESKYIDSYAMYGEVCFYDVDGMDMFLDYDDPSDLLTEGIIARMKDVAIKGNLSEDEQREILSNRIDSCVVIKQRVPKDEISDMIIKKQNEHVL